LRQAIEAALRRRLRHSEQIPVDTGVDSRTLDADLRKTTARLEEAKGISNRIADSLPALQPGIFARAAERLTMLGEEPGGGADAGAVVRTTAMATVQDQTRALQQALASVADELVEKLDSAAQRLDTPNRPSNQEFHSLVREMPVLDVGSIEVTSGRPVLIGLAGERLARRRLTQWLTKQLRPQMVTALTVYSRLLRDWASQVLTQMQRRFAAYADAYRAQAERSATSSELSSEERRALQRDIELLATRTAEAAEPAQQAS
jgi:hypothetical protein